ncbi:uncharacterized protein LOC142356106 [Convolutriloba macropyga]|uniref:uncharacterized protein LOC142356106 n=1 Tax=Convolutriloba macropyga TaxID=536237 RepID=UPI003F52530C
MAKTEVRLALLGDSGVGKTSLIWRLTKKNFDSSQFSPTVGASFFMHSVAIEDKVYEVQIWDTAGQEQFHSLASTYYRNAQAVIVVFDITNSTSFLTAQKWVGELFSTQKKYSILLIGNKVDLPNRTIFTSTAVTFAQSVGIRYMEVSAKTAENIDSIFNELIWTAKQLNLLIRQPRPDSHVRLEETTEMNRKKHKLCLFC